MISNDLALRLDPIQQALLLELVDLLCDVIVCALYVGFEGHGGVCLAEPDEASFVLHCDIDGLKG